MDAARILVVEDEVFVGRDMQATLERLGYEVVGMERSGEAALRYLRGVSRIPDLVLMDVRLEGALDGLEAAKRIRRDYGVPVVFVTGLLDHELAERLAEVDAFGCLAKPLDERELHAAVVVALQRSRAESEHGASGRRCEEAVRSMADGMITVDLAGFVTSMNPAAERLTGWAAVDAIGCPLAEVFRVTLPSGEPAAAAPDEMSDDEIVDESTAAAGLMSGRRREGVGRSVILTTRTGELLAVEDASSPIVAEDGSLAGLVVVFRPRPDSPVMRDADPSWVHLVGIVESIEDPLFAVDARWRITYANRQAAGYFGRPRGELPGADLWSVIPRSIQPSCQPQFYGSLLHREARSFELHQESRSAWFDVHTYPLGEGLLVLFRDVSERKAAEEQRAKVEKLESLGLLARGFAHDFNNLLTILLGNLSLASLRLPDDSPARNEVETAKNATLHAQNLVQQLLTFAKGGAPIKQHTDLAALIAETLHDHRRRPGLDYRVEIGDGLDPLEVDPHQIKRLLINLIRNAEEASPEGGVVSIRCRPETDAPGPHDRIAGLTKPQGSRVILEVEDAGHGIRREDLPHVFEPYFTTRTEANATGIGLTVCESIARGHDGAITVHSTPGEGTRVSVFLPTGSGMPDQDDLLDESHFVPPGAGDRQRRILVLEDEPLIRQLAEAQLAGAGYAVDTAADGQEAVRRYRNAMNEGRRYDLLILDLTIPNGMGGARAIGEILEIDPDALAVVSSGYSDDPAMAHPREYGFRAVLPKPYDPRALTTLVDRLLGRSHPA